MANKASTSLLDNADVGSSIRIIRAFWENHPDAGDDSPDARESEGPPSSGDASSRTGDTPPTYVEEARQKHARAYAKWSDEEDESLRRTWEGLKDRAASSSSRRAGAPESAAAKIRAIADDFDRKPGAIRSRLRKLGLIDA